MIRKLKLFHFRNYQQGEVVFAPRANYIYGENAQGKTNLIEALYIMSLGRSFRAHRLHNVIQLNNQSSYLEVEFDHCSQRHTLSMIIDNKGKKISHNQKPIKQLSDLIGLLPIVVLSAKDKELIIGSPAARRSFLNIVLSQKDPAYARQLGIFSKALMHRNASLKQGASQTISVWNEQLSLAAGYITWARQNIAQQLNQHILSLWENQNKDQFSLLFRSPIHPVPTELSVSELQHLWYDLLDRNLSKDLLLKTTSVGPHREDLVFLSNNQPASIFCSEGQKTTFLVLLKTAESLLLRCEQTRKHPLICIDDFHASLDEPRSQSLMTLLTSRGQHIITTTRPPYIEASQDCRVFFIHNATIHTKPISAFVS